MSALVKQVEPKILWGHFADLNAVPRASKKEERVIQFMVDFAKSLNLEYLIDEVGNVIVKKPATPGMEDRQTVVLQSHLDMVHQKNAETNFDFDSGGNKDANRRRLDSCRWYDARADNGIGVATIMAVLSSDTIKHPAVEALFTIDEETGMTGALGLKGGLLEATIMLNLDTEDDEELTIGCAGGIDVTAKGTYITTDAPVDAVGYKIAVRGLTGGHSGMDIHKGRGNANKLMNRILLALSKELKLFVSFIDGGGLRNAIPRESFSEVVIAKSDEVLFKKLSDSLLETLKDEYESTDADFEMEVSTISKPSKIVAPEFLYTFLRAVYSCPNGIYRMSPDIDDLVQSSNNLARVLIKDGSYEVLCLTRSSVDTEKMDVAQAVSAGFEIIGAAVTHSGSYPGWTPKPNAPIIKMMSDLYQEMFNSKPHVNACHAGLECGILGTNYPAMDMISFGPNIRGAHSPDERVQISSVQKYWKYFLNVLERIPAKN